MRSLVGGPGRGAFFLSPQPCRGLGRRAEAGLGHGVVARLSFDGRLHLQLFLLRWSSRSSM